MRCAGSMLDFLGADSEIGTESSLVVSVPELFSTPQLA
jgi:hypothetical protein